MEAVNESESESGEYGSSDEESFTESDAEPQQTQTQPAKPQDQRLPSSSDEEDSGSESDFDSDSPDSNVRPLACKSIVHAPVVPVSVTPAKSAAPKRPAEETVESKDAKKPRAAEAETSEKKILPFERLWSEDDEIVVLKGMIDYSSEMKSDPMLDLNAFHEFIKDDLHTDFSRAQLQDKIRRLKKKFDISKTRVKEGKSFKPHEQKVYDLSKLIWVNETANGSSVKKTATKKVNAPVSEEVKEAKKAVGPMKLSSSMEDKMLIAGRELEGRDEWEDLKVEEMELYLKQLELKVIQTRLVLDAMKAKKASH